MALPFRMKIKTAPQLSPWNRKLLSFLNAMSHERPALQHEQSFREMRDLAASAQTDAAKKLELQIGNYCLDWLGAETSIRIALNAGAAFQPGFTGHWGLAVLTSPNFGSAIRVAAKYFAMSPYNQVPTITIGEDVATLVGRDSRQLGRARDVITAFDIASGWRFLTILIGGKLSTREIEIPLPQSPSANELKKIFGVVPKFSRASQSRFVFDASCMRVPLMLADAELSAAHAEACALVADRTPNGSPVAQAVRDYLVRYQHSNPRARDVSRALATSERTLRRRLLEEGLSYSQLLEDVKRALACEMLSNTPLSITQISERVGFGESSNFSLAFKRWTGVTPRAFRARATDKST